MLAYFVFQVTSVVLSITAICEGGVTNGKIENVDEKNQTKRSIANAFSSNPIFRRVFHRGYSQNSLQNRFFDHSDAYDKYPQENYKISSQVIYIRPFSETVTTASPNDNKELNIFDNSEEDENEGNDQLKNVNEKSMEEEDAASGNVTTQITVFSVTKEEENVKSELYGEYRNIQFFYFWVRGFTPFLRLCGITFFLQNYISLDK